MKVAAVQFAPIFRQPADNLSTMETLVQEAASNGANMVTLPEMAVTGYSFMSEDEARPYSEIAGIGVSFRLMAKLSKNLGVAIAWGFMEQAGDTLYNSQSIVTPEGGHTSTRKRNMYGNDYLWATPGDVSPTIIDWKGRTIGLLICRDVRDKNDKLNDVYEPGDADIVAFSSNFGSGGFPSGSWVDFAMENKTNLVVSNRYGEEVVNNFGHGGICVIRPNGKVEAQGLQWDKPCIVYADV